MVENVYTKVEKMEKEEFVKVIEVLKQLDKVQQFGVLKIIDGIILTKFAKKRV